MDSEDWELSLKEQGTQKKEERYKLEKIIMKVCRMEENDCSEDEEIKIGLINVNN